MYLISSLNEGSMLSQYFSGCALIQIPDLLLRIYDYLKRRMYRNLVRNQREVTSGEINRMYPQPLDLFDAAVNEMDNKRVSLTEEPASSNLQVLMKMMKDQNDHQIKQNDEQTKQISTIMERLSIIEKSLYLKHSKDK